MHLGTGDVNGSGVVLGQKWQVVSTARVTVGKRRRALNEAHVASLMRSFEATGSKLLIQPIVVTDALVLVDGAHRLEAAKRAGWCDISAVVFSGLDGRALAAVEWEANRLRLAFSPLEVFYAWRQLYLPELTRLARQRRARGGARASLARSGGTAAVIENFNNKGADHARDARAHLSLAQEAKRLTGLSIATLKQIEAIDALAHSAVAPAELRVAAERALQRLDTPNGRVHAEYRSLMSLQERIDRSHALEHGRHEEPSDWVRRLVDDSTAMTMRIEQFGAGALSAALRAHPANRAELRSITHALVASLARVLTAEAMLDRDPRTALSRLSEKAAHSVQALALECLSEGKQDA